MVKVVLRVGEFRKVSLSISLSTLYYLTTAPLVIGPYGPNNHCIVLFNSLHCIIRCIV